MENPQVEVRIRCPYCAEWIMPQAIVCRYCGRDLKVKDVGVQASRPSPRPKAKADPFPPPPGYVSARPVHWLLGTAVFAAGLFAGWLAALYVFALEISDPRNPTRLDWIAGAGLVLTLGSLLFGLPTAKTPSGRIVAVGVLGLGVALLIQYLRITGRLPA